MDNKPFPIGMQTFRQIINGGFLYIDKTPWIYKLIRYPKGIYFLSRPRRFGKSLLISTLNEIFQGNRDLFQGLWLYDSPYQWTPHPVVHLDFSRYPNHTVEELENNISYMIQRLAEQHQITLHAGTYAQQFESLIAQLAQQNQVVILVDEYDKPLLDNINNYPDVLHMREVLKGFYTVIKSVDTYTRFVFLTGVSKFSKVGVFSGLNNLNDISLDNRYSAIVGVTQEELETQFQPYLPAFAHQEGVSEAALINKIRHWYNGFCFSDSCQLVYNPFSLLLLFEKQAFRSYWFESGTPTFLIKLIKEQQYDISALDNLKVDLFAFTSYEIDDLRLIPLLFQSGYLTIKGFDQPSQTYQLYYPNAEVEDAFLRVLLGAFGPVSKEQTRGQLWQLMQALQAGNLERFFEVLQIFFASIPYDIKLKREKYYQTIFYLIFKLLGLQINAEARTNRGRIDAVIELEASIFLFEFKLDGSSHAALKQIWERAYFKSYQGQGKPITLIGVNFSTETGEIGEWQSQSLYPRQNSYDGDSSL